MNLNQKVISGAALAALLVAAAWMTTISSSITKYTVLYAQLTPQSAGDIRANLDQRRIPYKISQNGSSIEVPADQADRLKMELSAQGLPESGIVGYEILDTTNFGMSDYLMKINYRRAMEGELRRTLRTLDEVEDAFVKIAIPEPSLYNETKQTATASVVLKLKRGRSLADRSVEAVTNLIASSISGLDPKNVTVVDARGNLLTKPSRDEFAMLSSSQMEMNVNVDRYLADKVKSMLDGAFGMGKALITVNADLDFDRVERTSTTYDQERSAIRSQEQLTVTNSSADGGGQENTVTNYETGQIVEKLLKSPGNISKLTVSVLLDGRDSTWVDPKGKTQYAKVPWTTAQLASIRTISENAVGYSQTRGDRLEVVSMDFGSREMAAGGGGGGFSIQATIVESIRAIAIGLAIVAALWILFFIIRSISHTLDPSRLQIPADIEFEKKKSKISGEDEIEKETEKTVLVRKIVSKAIKDPEAIARSLKTFYPEG